LSLITKTTHGAHALSISKKELEQNFNEMWKVNWFWQIRQLSAERILVRFPPSKRIKELVE
jgi:hypothetical protein